MYRHYIRVDADSNVIHAFSDAFEQPHEGDLLVAQDGGRHFNLYLWYNKVIPRWYVKGDEIIERTDAEMTTLWRQYEIDHTPEPTEFEKLQAENEALKALIEDKDRENKNALFEIYSKLLGG
ncbi:MULTISPECIES: hypothetical protein [unclassified Paenibacillus]|uniref:hypothetical protein n=1 Tax=unclassified Paenibacillus TaxID=185978 RepID=UPI00096F0158|nr:hypothetical protein [Paenibacillus sp. FSL H8-0259]OMF31207.1 hypothetical protein BK132_07275 [Paenibacillus sp. FSL H8-0259]